MALAAQTGSTPHGESTRPPATGRRGMVASGSQHATIAGIQALQAGGNAVDAAVAVAAALNVAEPFMSGMGGVGIGLVYMADEGVTRTINFSGHAPNDIDPSSMTRDGHGVWPPIHARARQHRRLANHARQIRESASRPSLRIRHRPRRKRRAYDSTHGNNYCRRQRQNRRTHTTRRHSRTRILSHRSWRTPPTATTRPKHEPSRRRWHCRVLRRRTRRRDMRRTKSIQRRH